MTCYKFQDRVTLVDPTANEIKIYKPDGTLADTIATGNITKVSDGVWEAYWLIPSDADLEWWRAIWEATKQTYTSKEDATFEVKD